jgi:hypothetical protein
MILKTFEEYDIGLNKIFHILTDNAADMVG